MLVSSFLISCPVPSRVSRPLLHIAPDYFLQIYSAYASIDCEPFCFLLTFPHYLDMTFKTTVIILPGCDLVVSFELSSAPFDLRQNSKNRTQTMHRKNTMGYGCCSQEETAASNIRSMFNRMYLRFAYSDPLLQPAGESRLRNTPQGKSYEA